MNWRGGDDWADGRRRSFPGKSCQLSATFHSYPVHDCRRPCPLTPPSLRWLPLLGKVCTYQGTHRTGDVVMYMGEM